MVFDYSHYEEWTDQFVPVSWDDVQTEDDFRKNVEAVQRFDPRTKTGDRMFKDYFGFDIDDKFNIEKVQFGKGVTKVKTVYKQVIAGSARSEFEQRLEELNKIKDATEAMKLLGDIKQREGAFENYTAKEREAAVKLLQSNQAYKDLKEGFTESRRTRLEGFEIPLEYVARKTRTGELQLQDQWKKNIGEERIEIKGNNVRVKGFEEMNTDEILNWYTNRRAAVEKEAAGISIAAERERERAKSLRFLNNQLREAGYSAADMRREQKEREIVEIEGRTIRTGSQKARDLLREQKESYKERYGVEPPSKRKM
jgi:hypothetical protein